MPRGLGDYGVRGGALVLGGVEFGCSVLGCSPALSQAENSTADARHNKVNRANLITIFGIFISVIRLAADDLGSAHANPLRGASVGRRGYETPE